MITVASLSQQTMGAVIYKCGATATECLMPMQLSMRRARCNGLDRGAVVTATGSAMAGCAVVCFMTAAWFSFP